MQFRGYQDDKLEARFDFAHLQRLWPFVRPYRRQFGLCLLILLGSFGVEIVGPYLVRRAIDGPIRTSLDGGGVDYETIAWLGAAYLGITLAGAWLGFGYAIVTARNGARVVRDLRVHLYEHLFRLGPQFFDRNPAGKLVTRITSDVENLNELIATGVLQTLFDLVKIVGILAVLFVLDYELALFGVLVVPIVIGVSLGFRRFARDSYRKVRGRLARQNAFTAEFVGGVRATRAFGQAATVQRHFDELNESTRGGWRDTIFWFALFFAIVELALRWSQAGLLLIGGRAILEGSLTVGMFVQFWLYFSRLGEPIRELGEKYNVLQSAFASSERIFGILAEPALPPEPSAPRPSPRGPAGVQFDRVSFVYAAAPGEPPNASALDDVSFEVPAGTTCAFVGPTGAGKSTILSLVSRMRDPTSGVVRIDGVDVRDYRIAELRRRIAVVPQDVFLFTGTVLENLRLTDPNISTERVRAAVEEIGAGDFVDRLEGGLHAAVEERGATFSQGERQLLAMARALCHDPDLLILDEATANIDSDSEARIQRALAVLFAGRTVLVVAHRLSTVEHADQVLSVERGRATATRPLRPPR